MRRLVALLIALLSFTTAAAQSPNWSAVDAEALKTLQSYIRINTSVPPGDVTKAADLLAGILEREGIPVKRFESGPGRSIVLARLKGSGPSKPILLLHHMDVVPADAEPLGEGSVRRRNRRRQDLGARRDGHEGAGRGAPLRVHHAEAAERPARPRHPADGSARRGSGRRAGRDVDAREALSRSSIPSTSSTKAASAAAISSRPASWSSASRWRRRN